MSGPARRITNVAQTATPAAGEQTPPLRAYLGLGSNVGDKRAAIAQAVERLGAVAGITVVARSHDYRTPPWGDTDQDWFVNACVAVDTTLSPLALLDACLAVERAMGRERIRKWGPRNIDIDVLDYAGLTVRGDRLVLPHPLMLERAFVLLPLAEIAPGLHIAGHGIDELAGRLADTGIEPLHGQRAAR